VTNSFDLSTGQDCNKISLQPILYKMIKRALAITPIVLFTFIAFAADLPNPANKAKDVVQSVTAIKSSKGENYLCFLLWVIWGLIIDHLMDDAFC
jgi:hypothetical protein